MRNLLIVRKRRAKNARERVVLTGDRKECLYLRISAGVVMTLLSDIKESRDTSAKRMSISQDMQSCVSLMVHNLVLCLSDRK